GAYRGSWARSKRCADSHALDARAYRCCCTSAPSWSPVYSCRTCPRRSWAWAPRRLSSSCPWTGWRSEGRLESPRDQDGRTDMTLATQEPSTPTGSKPFVSIVMPCLNERQTVETCVRKALGWLERSGHPGEVLVVDNGSTDGSPELAANAGARVVFEPVRGYGSALRRGFREARGEWLVMGDCDDTYEFADLDPLMAPLYEGADMSIGNRFAGGIAPGAMTWSHRYIGTPAISFLLRLFTGLKVGDSQCGLRAFTREALERLDLSTDGMELASEMILKAARRDLKVADVPVPYAERLG